MSPFPIIYLKGYYTYMSIWQGIKGVTDFLDQGGPEKDTPIQNAPIETPAPTGEPDKYIFIDNTGKSITPIEETPDELSLETRAARLNDDLAEKYHCSDIMLRVDKIDGKLCYVLYRNNRLYTKMDAPESAGWCNTQKSIYYTRWLILAPFEMEVKTKDGPQKVILEPSISNDGVLIKLPYGYYASDAVLEGGLYKLPLAEKDLGQKEYFYLFVSNRSFAESSSGEKLNTTFENAAEKIKTSEGSEYIPWQIRPEGTKDATKFPVAFCFPANYEIPGISYNRPTSDWLTPEDVLSGNGEKRLKKDPHNSPKNSAISKDINWGELLKQFNKGVRIVVIIDGSGSMEENIDKALAPLEAKFEEIPTLLKPVILSKIEISIIISRPEGAEVVVPMTKASNLDISGLKNMLLNLSFRGGHESFEKGIDAARRQMGTVEQGQYNEIIILTDSEYSDDPSKNIYLSPPRNIKIIKIDEAMPSEGGESAGDNTPKNEGIVSSLKYLGYPDELIPLMTRYLSVMKSNSGTTGKWEIYEPIASAISVYIAAKGRDKATMEDMSPLVLSAVESYKKADGSETFSIFGILCLPLLSNIENSHVALLREIILSDVDYPLKRAAITVLASLAKRRIDGAREVFIDLATNSKDLLTREIIDERNAKMLEDEVIKVVDETFRAKTYLDTLTMEGPNAVKITDIGSCGFNKFTIDALLFIIENSDDFAQVSLALSHLIQLFYAATDNKIIVYPPVDTVEAKRVLEERFAVFGDRNEPDINKTFENIKEYETMLYKLEKERVKEKTKEKVNE